MPAGLLAGWPTGFVLPPASDLLESGVPNDRCGRGEGNRKSPEGRTNVGMTNVGILTATMARLNEEIQTWSRARMALKSDLVRQTTARRNQVSAMCGGFARDRAGAHRAWCGLAVPELRSAPEKLQPRQQAPAPKGNEPARNRVEAAKARAGKTEARPRAEEARSRAEEEARSHAEAEEEARRHGAALKARAEAARRAAAMHAKPQRQPVAKTAALMQSAPKPMKKRSEKH
jgi:hypothetical protein